MGHLNALGDPVVTLHRPERLRGIFLPQSLAALFFPYVDSRCYYCVTLRLKTLLTYLYTFGTEHTQAASIQKLQRDMLVFGNLKKRLRPNTANSC